MSIFAKWFGEWVVVSKRSVTAEVSQWGRSGKTDGVLVVERNTKSGKERASIKFINGATQEIDIDFVKDIK